MIANAPAEPSLAELRDRRRALKVRCDIARLERETAIMESIAGLSGWGGDIGGSDLYDRLRPKSNDDTDGQWVPLAVPSDRRHGANWPIWRNETELFELLQEARVLIANGGYALGLLRNIINNTIGKGFTYHVEPKLDEGEEADDEHAGLVKLCQAVADEFLKRNRWNGQTDPRTGTTITGSREQECCRREKRDGEVFLRFHFQPDGVTLVRFVEPECVRNPTGATWQDGWTYGIRHQMDPYEDVETPLEYCFYYPDPSAPGGNDAHGETYEIVPASEVLHLKGQHTDSTVKRGISDFLFDTGGALARASKLQRNTSIGASVRAATAEIWEMQNATQAGVQNLVGSLSISRPAPGGGSTSIEKMKPGSIRRVAEGMKLAPQPADNSESYMAAAQGDLRQGSAAFCAPEYWTGDASNGNYSSLETASSPAVRNGVCEQEYYKIAFGMAVWKALLWAAECNVLPAGALDRIEVQVEAPAVLHRNSLEVAQEDQIGVVNQWKDRETCAAERGLDYETVQRNNQAFAVSQPQPGGLGEDPSTEQDPPEPRQEQQGVRESAEERQAGLVSLLEALLAVARPPAPPATVVNPTIVNQLPAQPPPTVTNVIEQAPVTVHVPEQAPAAPTVVVNVPPLQAPAVNVNVEPTPITNVVNVPEPTPPPPRKIEIKDARGNIVRTAEETP